MTKNLGPSAASPDPDDERDHPFFTDPGKVTTETYPCLRNVSAGFMFKRVARALEPTLPEYGTLPLERPGSFSDGHIVAITKWNLLWESAQFRRRYFDENELPPEVGEIADRGDINVTLFHGQRHGITSTRRYITCCPSHRRSGMTCRLSVPGSGPLSLN